MIKCMWEKETHTAHRVIYEHFSYKMSAVEAKILLSSHLNQMTL